MIKVENIDVWGFEHAIRGLRNPMNSWSKSDSRWVEDWQTGEKSPGNKYYKIGDNDLDLMRRLYKAGSEHRKYLRQIFVSMDITAPLYLWAEIDTYKVGITRNSCSFMHKGVSKPFEIKDFSVHKDEIYEILSPVSPEQREKIKNDHKINKLTCKEIAEKYDITVKQANNIISQKLYENTELFLLAHIWEQIIEILNDLRDGYLVDKDDQVFQQIRCLLPCGYNQRATITMNYENVVNIIKQRTGHKLDEWNEFCKILQELPYIKEITNA